MEHTMLMSCVSGGALGASYFRELYLRKKLGEAINPYEEAYLDSISRNSLNPIVFNLITHDMLFNFNNFQLRIHILHTKIISIIVISIIACKKTT